MPFGSAWVSFCASELSNGCSDDLHRFPKPLARAYSRSEEPRAPIQNLVHCWCVDQQRAGRGLGLSGGIERAASFHSATPPPTCTSLVVGEQGFAHPPTARNCFQGLEPTGRASTRQATRRATHVAPDTRRTSYLQTAGVWAVWTPIIAGEPGYTCGKARRLWMYL